MSHIPTAPQNLVNGGNVPPRRKPVQRILLTPVDAIIGAAIYLAVSLLDTPVAFAATHLAVVLIIVVIINSVICVGLGFYYVRNGGYAPLASLVIMFTGMGAYLLGTMFLNELH